MSGLNQRALDRAREHIALITEQQRAYAREHKRANMSVKRTKYGLAKKPPAIKRNDEDLDGWHGQIAEALDAASALGVALREYVREHPNADDPSAPFWPGRSVTERSAKGNASGLDYDKPWNRSAFNKQFFRPALKLAGLPDDVRLHDLRHSFASIAASNGVPAAQVAVWMGHGNEVVTRTIYTHLFREDTKPLRRRHERGLPPVEARHRDATTQRGLSLPHPCSITA